MARLEKELINIDRVIHAPARLAIISLLADVEEADFLYLMREAGLSKGNLSAHLSKLTDSGYVEIEKSYRGKLPLTLCRLTPDGRKAFERYLGQLRHLMQHIDTN